MGDAGNLLFHADFHYEIEVHVVEGLPGFFVTNPTTGAVDVGRAWPRRATYNREVNDLNASLTYAMKNGLEMTVWGRNLLNDRYINTVFDLVAQTGSVSGYTNQPRTYGVNDPLPLVTGRAMARAPFGVFCRNATREGGLRAPFSFADRPDLCCL